MILSDWAKSLGLATPNLLFRLERWPKALALTLPKGSRLFKTGPQPKH